MTGREKIMKKLIRPNHDLDHPDHEDHVLDIDELLESQIDPERRPSIYVEEDAWVDKESLKDTIMNTPHYFTSLIFIPVVSVIYAACFIYFIHNDWPDEDCFSQMDDGSV